MPGGMGHSEWIASAKLCLQSVRAEPEPLRPVYLQSKGEMEKERLELDLSLIELNEGQLSWLPKNPRTWTQTDIDKTAASIKQDPDFLEDRPLLVVSREDSPNLVVFAGNLRSVGARAARLSRVPCVLYSPEEDEDYETIRRRAMKDNGSFGQFDWDEVFSSPWGQMDLDSMGIGKAFQQGGDPFNFNEGVTDESGEQPKAQEDNFDENADAIQVRCKPGDIWQLGEHRLMCGDSIDLEQVKKLIGGALVDMILTDPPYGTTALEWDKAPNLRIMFDNYKAICAEPAAILSFGAQPFITDLINTARESFRHEIIWKKTMASGYLSVNKAPMKIHENIVCFSFGRLPYYPVKVKEQEATGRVREQKANRGKQYRGCGSSTYIEDGTRYITDVIEYSNWNGALFGNTENAVMHPTQKPVGLLCLLLQMYSQTGNAIFDGFGGSGSTLIAAESTGRKCYMMEIAPHYCDVILARWEKLTGKTATKITA